MVKREEVDYMAEVYLLGSVAEGRTTIYSDIDIMIVVRDSYVVEKRRLYVKALERAIDEYGLP